MCAAPRLTVELDGAQHLSDPGAPPGEAIERAVDYDDWFIREVDKGLAQIDAGQVLTHDAMGARLEQKVAEYQSRR